MSPKQKTALPMIVDIAIDQDGKELYQVHESNNAVRKEMPMSDHFKASPNLNYDPNTPSLEDQSPTFHEKNNESPGVPPLKRKDSSDSVNSDGNREENLWSKDVQSAFEEALAIVPKNGLNKIKLGGKARGRNELISDFIFAKAGKIRSRKQVSSHIQVIKNTTKDGELVRLISDGPKFESEEEAEQSTKYFEEIFSKINLDKSLGKSTFDVSKISAPTNRRHSSAALHSETKRRKQSQDEPFSQPAHVCIKDISLTVDGDFANAGVITVSKQTDQVSRLLSIRENAAISSRFPGLEDFQGTDVPILHAMCRVYNPLVLPPGYSIENGLMSSYMLEYSKPDDNLASFTTVYSYGNEVLKVNDDYFKTNIKQPFLLKFWKCFYLQLMDQPSSLDAALKGITIKQVIYDSSDCTSSMIPKRNIKAVLLFEFSRVHGLDEATCTTSRLLLPHSLGYASINPDNSNYSIRAHSEKLPYGLSGEDLGYPSRHSFETDHTIVAQPLSYKSDDFGFGSLQYTPPDSGLQPKLPNFAGHHQSFPTYYQTPFTATHPATNIEFSGSKNQEEGFPSEPFYSHY